MMKVCQNDDRRVVVTGIGIVAANGIGVNDFWQTLIAGRSGVGPITLFDASKFPNRIAAEVKGFDPKLHLPASVKWKRMGRHTHFALAALDMAVKDAALSEIIADSVRPVSVIIGVSTSAIEIVQSVAYIVQDGATDRVRPQEWSGPLSRMPCRPL